MLESSVAVICACLPTLKPVLNHLHLNETLRSWGSKFSLQSLIGKTSRSSANRGDGSNYYKASSSLESLTGTGKRAGQVQNEIIATPAHTAGHGHGRDGVIKVETSFGHSTASAD